MKPVVTLLAAGLKVTVEITGCLHDTESGVAGFWEEFDAVVYGSCREIRSFGVFCAAALEIQSAKLERRGKIAAK